MPITAKMAKHGGIMLLYKVAIVYNSCNQILLADGLVEFKFANMKVYSPK